jgi:hypothetical protein
MTEFHSLKPGEADRTVDPLTTGPATGADPNIHQTLQDSMAWSPALSGGAKYGTGTNSEPVGIQIDGFHFTEGVTLFVIGVPGRTAELEIGHATPDARGEFTVYTQASLAPGPPGTIWPDATVEARFADGRVVWVQTSAWSMPG